MQQLTYAPLYTRALDQKSRSVDAVLSSETIDGHGEIIDQASWQLERYRRNPVVLYMHSPFAVVGSASNIRVSDGQLVARITFATTPQADEVFTLFRDGAMRAFSVGFRVGRVEQQQIDGKTVRRLLDNELMEVSAVSIPSNPDALVNHKSLGLVPASYTLGSPGSEIAAEALKGIDGDDDAVDSIFASYGRQTRTAENQPPAATPSDFLAEALRGLD